MTAGITYIKDLDSHYIINILGIRFLIKHKSKFQYKAAENFGLNKPERSQKLIVSLTSFPARIESVHITINTILRQNLKPDKVILWLAKEEFPGGTESLPEELKKLQHLGLEIEWCENWGSYKKIIPTLQKYPNDIIVTADDDLYYEEDWLESLYNEYLKNPKNIYVRRAARVARNNNSYSILSARKTGYTDIEGASYFNQMLGGSGCLFPPGSLYKDILDREKAVSLLPTHDDIYLWGMAVLNKTKICVVKGYKANLYVRENTQHCGLCKINNKNKGVSQAEAYKILLGKYPQIKEILEGGNA